VLLDMAKRKGAAPARVSLIIAGTSPQLLAARHRFEPEGFAPLLDGVVSTDGPVNWQATAELVRQTLIPGERVTGLLASAFPINGLAGLGESYTALPDFGFLPGIDTPPVLSPSLD